MASRIGESRKYDGPRLRGNRETNELLKNLGLNLGFCENRFAMYAAAVGLEVIAKLDPDAAEAALKRTRKLLGNASLPFDDVLKAERESLLRRAEENDERRTGLLLIHQKLGGGD